MSDAPSPAGDPDHTIAFQGVPGAYSHLACRQAYPEMVALPCHSFEDAFAAVREGQARYAMIAGRQLDRRPGRRRPPPSAPWRSAHHRRAVRSGESPAARGARRQSRDHQGGREPRPRHRPVPRIPAPSRLSRPRGRGHRGRCGRCRRRRRPEPGRHRLAARRRDLRTPDPQVRHRGRRAQHHPLPGHGTGAAPSRSQGRPGDHQLHVPRAEPAGRSLQGAGRLRAPAAST